MYVLISSSLLRAVRLRTYRLLRQLLHTSASPINTSKMNKLVFCFLVASLLISSTLIDAKKYASTNTLVQPTARREKKESRAAKLNEAAAGLQRTASVDSVVAAAAAQTKVSRAELPPAIKLLIGAGGIYAAFLYYGTLQEDVFHYTAQDGTKFKAAWFLQTLEALANVVIGFIGLQLTGGSAKGLPLKIFALGGTTQVFAKAFTSLSLANGLSFPVATLAKSGKMVPVMIGSILLGGAKYTLREYTSVAAIIAGTMMVSMGKKAGGPGSSTLGVVFICLSLFMDGITGGLQKKIKVASSERGLKPKPYDFMFWTNLFMAGVAATVAVVLGDMTKGIDFCVSNPVILNKILKFSLCSAVGQSFIFYTISNFDPLVTTTVTTTRKVFSVLLSIFLNGHKMSPQGWAGIGLASLGIMSEMQDKSSGHGKKAVDEKK